MAENPYDPTPGQNPQNMPLHASTPQQPGPHGPYQQNTPVAAGSNNLTLNYWLSVFFTIIPATIFYYTEKNKDPRAYQFHKANLYFSITRFLLNILLTILAIVSGSGLALMFDLAITCILFGMHMSAAIIVKEKYYSGANERPLPLWPRIN